MIVNKTIELCRLRHFKKQSVQTISVDDIRKDLVKISELIEVFKQQLHKNLLPSFVPKEKQNQEILKLKDNLNNLIESTENKIKTFDCAEMKIVKAIKNYFFDNLRKFVLKYRSVQQEHVKKTDIYSDYCTESGIYKENEQLETMISQKCNVRESIFRLTNTLIELKMAIKDQNQYLDRIDYFVDETNFYLENANREIIKIPGNYTKFKDMIIYILIYIVCVLLVLILIKQMKKR